LQVTVIHPSGNLGGRVTAISTRSILLACALCAMWVPAASAQAQPAPSMQPITLLELVLRDGSRMYGTIARETPDEIVFTTHAGATLTVRRGDIASLRKISGAIQGGEFLPPDPNTTRLFFAPTARSLGRGQVYLGVYEFIAPFVQVGITDRISIGGGTPLIFGVDDWDRPFWVTPKVQVLDARNTQVAAGVLHAFDSDGDGGGIAYGVVSHGTDVRSFTAGAGLAYANDGGRAGVLMVGGEARVRRGIKIITENYIWKGGHGVASVGFRFFGEHLSADLALAVPIGADDLVAFPMINFVYVF
jgi:hypothetical protein